MVNEAIKKLPKSIITYTKPRKLRIVTHYSWLSFKHIISNSRDDLDVSNRPLQKVKEETFMVSFDMISLYTSIPQKYGLEAIQF